MKYFLGILASVWTLIYGLALAWLALWAASLINYLLSLLIGWVGLIFDGIASAVGGVVEYIHIFITMGWSYLIIYYILFSFMSRDDSTLDDALFECSSKLSKAIPYMIVFLVMIFMIAVCDTRIDQFMPDKIVAGLEFLRHDCGTFILPPVDWSELDFSGQNLISKQCDVFDVSICIAGMASLIRNCFDL